MARIVRAWQSASVCLPRDGQGELRSYGRDQPTAGEGRVLLLIAYIWKRAVQMLIACPQPPYVNTLLRSVRQVTTTDLPQSSDLLKPNTSTQFPIIFKRENSGHHYY